MLECTPKVVGKAARPHPIWVGKTCPGLDPDHARAAAPELGLT